MKVGTTLSMVMKKAQKAVLTSAQARDQKMLRNQKKIRKRRVKIRRNTKTKKEKEENKKKEKKGYLR